MDHKTLGRQIRIARQKRGMTMEQLAAKVTPTLSTIARMEAGKIESPSWRAVVEIAEALDVPLDDLRG